MNPVALIKVGVALYLMQAAFGFAIGFTLPWLYHFGVM